MEATKSIQAKGVSDWIKQGRNHRVFAWRKVQGSNSGIPASSPGSGVCPKVCQEFEACWKLREIGQEASFWSLANGKVFNEQEHQQHVHGGAGV